MERHTNLLKKWVLPRARPVRQSSVSDSLRVLDGTPSARVTHFFEKGQLIVEVLVAFGLASLLIPVIIFGI